MFAEACMEAHVGLLVILCDTSNKGLLTRSCIDILWDCCQLGFVL